MSWDVFIQHLPMSARRVADIPDEYEGKVLGTRDEVIAKIRAKFPDADFSDPSWGTLVRDGYSIDICVNGDDIATAITLHVRGADGAVDAVNTLIAALGARALDSWTSEIYEPAIALHSIRRWRAYLQEME
ncbi:MAG: hypothetical protein JJE51_02275 [Thermoanaerobaculia bacterium]|nr:hypothetical protein [Thermoanaerobaculia bacterium]